MSDSRQPLVSQISRNHSDRRARVAIDLGAESCRVSLLRWRDDRAHIELIHRIPNGPVHDDGSLRWPFETIFQGLQQGLRNAAEAASEGIASIAVDGWAVDYVRLRADGLSLEDPHCYRDERTIVSKAQADRIVPEEWWFRHTGAQPLRINTAYQLLADRAAGIDVRTPWLNLPEYVLYRLGGQRVAEYTNATHTGLVNVETGDWSEELLSKFDLPRESFPPIVPTGAYVGKLAGTLTELPAFRDTDLIAPACHDTASAIAGIPSSLEGTAYICSGTWSLVGTRVSRPITSNQALQAGFTNQGAAGEGFCFHRNVNGMWILKQCLESWRRKGRHWVFAELIAKAEACGDFPGIVNVDAPPLLLDGDMPAFVNEQLSVCGHTQIEDCAGNEPIFARVIFESLADRYASALHGLEEMLGDSIRRIHVLGGGSLNRLLTRLTAERSGLSVETGNPESSTIGNFAVQLAAAATPNQRITCDQIRQCAQWLCETGNCGIASAPDDQRQSAGV